MADAIVTSYEVKVDALRQQVTQLEAEYSKLDKAGVDSAKKVSAAYTEQSKILDNLKKQIELLTATRDKETDTAKIAKINTQLAEMEGGYKRLSAAIESGNAPLQRQLGIIENMRQRINRLADAREREQNPQRIQRYNQLLAEQQSRLNRVTGATQQQATSTNFLGRQFDSLARSIVAAVAVERLLAFAGDSVKKFADAQEQTDRLTFSITKLGNEGTDALESLNRQARELSNATGSSFFSQSEITNAQNLLSQFGLTRAQIEKLIPGILDMSVALNQDLPSATQTAIGAMTGTTKGLKIINGDFQDTGTTIGNYNKLLEVTAGIQGTAANALNTLTGEMKKQKADADDLQELIGGKLADAYVNLKNIALQAAAGLLGLRKNQPTDRVGLFASMLGDVSDTDIASRLTATQKQIADIQQQAAAIDARETDSGGKLLALDKQLKILIDRESAFKRVIQERALASSEAARTASIDTLRNADLSNRNRESLLAEIELLKKRDDARTPEIGDEITRRLNQIKKIDEAEKKAAADSIQARKDALEQLRAMNDKFNEQRLQSFAKSELDSLEVTRQVETQRARLQFERAGGEGNPEAVAEFTKVLENLNAAVDERIADNRLRKNEETAREIAQMNEENLSADLQATLNAIDNSEAAEIQRLRAAYIAKGDFSVTAEQQLQDRIDTITRQSERARLQEKIRFIGEAAQRQIDQAIADGEKLKQIEIDAFEKRGDESEKAKQRLADRINEIDADTARKTDAISQGSERARAEIEQDLTKVVIDENDKRLAKAELTAQQEIELRRRVVETSFELISQLANVEAASVEGRIQQLEIEKEQSDERYDAEQQALEDRYNNRLITERQFELQSEEIKKRRVANEKKLEAQINAEKRKADLINRQRTLFEISVNTAAAIMRVTRDIPFPASLPLIALTAALGIAQAAAVLATPLPKYAKGTRYLKRTRGEPMGTDTITIQADEGERIVPRKNNIRHWKWYNALEDGTFDRRAHEHFVLPALMKYQTEQRKKRAQSASENIVRAFIQQAKPDGENDNTLYELRRLFSKGINVKNIDELREAARVKSIYTN